ncbi:FHA domain-containing protein [Brevibacillus dissolubilis]|uniref:FHA domain-containing protein n=1 Tax=Brevibacillus dissolubilis TaxID=1844116 RepID=UPI001115FAC0|nr:FHA domain-containing protein [Brevibacillus dissolubilis]
MLDRGVYLVIEKGESEQAEQPIYIEDKEILIGRRWQQHTPDISFTSLYISRKHAVIQKINDSIVISDLKSMHGTAVNGKVLEGTPHILRNGDQISLANGEAVLVFTNVLEDFGNTLEFKLPPNLSELVPEKKSGAGIGSGLVIRYEQREILINGSPLYISGKEMDLLMYLYQRSNQAVSYEEIKLKIWPERTACPSDELPDVGREEINVLVYRLRKRLGLYGGQVVSVPRYGYMLKMEQNVTV